MAMKYDDSGFRPRGWGGNGNGNGNGGNGQGSGPMGFGPTKFAAFMPGQKGLLAQQLGQGFGGVNQWKGLLGNTFDPVTVPGFTYGQGANGNGGGNGGPDWTKQQLATMQPFISNPDPRAINNQAFMELSQKMRDYIMAQRAKNPTFGSFT